ALGAKALTEAMLYRHALYYACLGDPFDGKEAVRVGLANVAVPSDRLEEETEKLAHKLMAKSPLVLRATKQAMRAVRTMDVVQSYEYLAAKSAALKTADPEDSYNAGLSQFLDKKY